MKIIKLLVSCFLVCAVTLIQAKTVTFSSFLGVQEVQDSVFNLDTSIYNIRGFSVYDDFLTLHSSKRAQSELVASGVSGSDECYFGSLYLVICSAGRSGVTLPGSGGDQQGSGSEGDGSLLGGAGGTTVVPVPGAVWLFGSALIGLFGAGRRKG